jgi:hypothetical protein
MVCGVPAAHEYVHGVLLQSTLSTVTFNPAGLVVMVVTMVGAFTATPHEFVAVRASASVI